MPIQGIPQMDQVDAAFGQAVGEELRLARELNGWPLEHLAARLPFDIDVHELASYEDGTEPITAVRYNQLCRALRAPAPTLLHNALQRARLYKLVPHLRVNLRQLAHNTNVQFLPVAQWAHNQLTASPNTAVELPWTSIQELADTIDRPHHELIDYLAGFLPPVSLAS